MFKRASCENEVAEAMAQNLKLNRLENKHAFTKIPATIDALATAAEVFDSTGHSNEAETLTRMIESLAGVKTAAFVDLSLDPKDRAFFDKLPKHHQEHLKKQDVKPFMEEVRKLRMAHEAAKELESRKQPKEVIEFESLLPRGKQLPESSFPQDVIEFESLKDDDMMASDVSMHAAKVSSVQAAFEELGLGLPKKKAK